MSPTQLSMLRQIEPVHAFPPEDLRKAVEHLYKAKELISSCRESMVNGMLESKFSQQLADSWWEVNKCRTVTEKVLFIEEILIPSMGLINDAKSMFDTLTETGLGMTRHGFINIMQWLDEALLGISMCLEELESWMEP